MRIKITQQTVTLILNQSKKKTSVENFFCIHVLYVYWKVGILIKFFMPLFSILYWNCFIEIEIGIEMSIQFCAF